MAGSYPVTPRYRTLQNWSSTYHLLHLTTCGWIWAGPLENVSYIICEQQRQRSACASTQSDQRLCCSVLRKYTISRFYSRNFKILASFCGCAGRFVSGVVGNSWRHVFSCSGSYHFCTWHIQLYSIHNFTYNAYICKGWLLWRYRTWVVRRLQERTKRWQTTVDDTPRQWYTREIYLQNLVCKHCAWRMFKQAWY